MTTGSLRGFAAYAKAHGMASDSVSYYHRQKTAGRLVIVERAGKELVDFEASLTSLQATSDPGKSYMTEVNDRQRAVHQSAASSGSFERSSEAAGGFSSGSTSGSKNSTYMQAKTAREVYDAKMSQLDYEREIGKLIEKTAVERAVYEAARGLRDGMTNCSRRLAAEVATLTTPGECEVIIAKELRHLLDAFSRQLAQKITPTQSAES